METCPICGKQLKRLAVYAMPGHPPEMMCDDCVKAKGLRYWTTRGADGLKMTHSDGTVVFVDAAGKETVVHQPKAGNKWWKFWK